MNATSEASMTMVDLLTFADRFYLLEKLDCAVGAWQLLEKIRCERSR